MKEKPSPPVCCGKPMAVNAHVARVSGPRVQYKCYNCGRTKAVKVEK